MKRVKPDHPALTAAQAALLAHADEWHAASGASPRTCRDCGDLILAVERERWPSCQGRPERDPDIEAILAHGRAFGLEVGE